MKVILNSKTVFVFPTRLIANGLLAHFISKKTKKAGIRLTKRQIMTLLKEFRKHRKNFPDGVFLEVTEKNGDSITIKV